MKTSLLAKKEDVAGLKVFGERAGDVKAIFRIAESNLDALITVDLGPKRPFRVGECAPWAR